LSYIPTFCPTI